MSINSFSLIVFEKGYFINNFDVRTECLIRNVDWKDNPTKFSYKTGEDSIVCTADIKDVKEFGIYQLSKYVRSTVKIDQSGEDVNELRADKNPIFVEEELFLKVLIEGLATLYVYEDKNFIRFFYKTNNSEIEQLVYKKYMTNNNVSENNSFRQQLFNALKNQQISISEFENLRYSQTELTKLFVKFNKAENTNFTTYKLIQPKDFFHLTIRPGLNINHLAIENSLTSLWDNDYGSKITFRFGVESEYILPFRKNTWSAILEPTYQYYYAESKKETYPNSGSYSISGVRYQSVEIPLGIRHYFYLNNRSKIFADISGVFDLSFNSTLKLYKLDGSVIGLYDIISSPNLSFGIGYKGNSKLNFEFRYQSNRQILSDWETDYGSVSVIIDRKSVV